MIGLSVVMPTVLVGKRRGNGIVTSKILIVGDSGHFNAICPSARIPLIVCKEVSRSC